MVKNYADCPMIRENIIKISRPFLTPWLGDIFINHLLNPMARTLPKRGDPQNTNGADDEHR